MDQHSSRLPRMDGDRGITRVERSERTAFLLDKAAACTDPAERDALLSDVIILNRGVAEAVSRRYVGRGIAREDLQQVAYEGLTKAVQRFDPATSNDLLAFAVPTMRGELLRHFRDHGWSVRPPRRLQELQWRVNKKIGELEQRTGREPSHLEVKRALGISDEDYRDAIEAFGCFRPTSLDQPATADSTSTLGDVIPGDDVESAASEARVMLSSVVRRLPARDRRILRMRFFDDLTQAEIGESLGITQFQVSRLLSQIFVDLRKELGPATRVDCNRAS